MADKHEKSWEDTGGLFETTEEAKEEIRAICSTWDKGVVSHGEFVIVPNDGKCLRAFQPLDFGDVIYSSEAKGKPEDYIIEPDWWKKEGLK